MPASINQSHFLIPRRECNYIQLHPATTTSQRQGCASEAANKFFLFLERASARQFEEIGANTLTYLLTCLLTSLAARQRHSTSRLFASGPEPSSSNSGPTCSLAAHSSISICLIVVVCSLLPVALAPGGLCLLISRRKSQVLRPFDGFGGICLSVGVGRLCRPFGRT